MSGVEEGAAPAGPTNPGVRFPPPLLFVGGFAAGLELQRLWPAALLPPPLLPARAWLGWTLVALGLGSMLSGLLTFWGARTAVLPHHAARRLVISGPYRVTRNPMYLGLTLAYLGGGVLLDTVWVPVLLPVALTALTYAVIHREERYLAAAFGPEYEAYRRRVRRWI